MGLFNGLTLFKRVFPFVVNTLRVDGSIKHPLVLVGSVLVSETSSPVYAEFFTVRFSHRDATICFVLLAMTSLGKGMAASHRVS